MVIGCYDTARSVQQIDAYYVQAVRARLIVECHVERTFVLVKAYVHCLGIDVRINLVLFKHLVGYFVALNNSPAIGGPLTADGLIYFECGERYIGIRISRSYTELCTASELSAILCRLNHHLYILSINLLRQINPLLVKRIGQSAFGLFGQRIGIGTCPDFIILYMSVYANCRLACYNAHSTYLLRLFHVNHEPVRHILVVVGIV